MKLGHFTNKDKYRITARVLHRAILRGKFRSSIQHDRMHQRCKEIKSYIKGSPRNC